MEDPKSGQGFAPTAAGGLRKGYNNLMRSFKITPRDSKTEAEDMVTSFNWRQMHESDTASVSCLSELSSDETPRQRAGIALLSDKAAVDRPQSARPYGENAAEDEEMDEEERKMLEEQMEMMRKESEVRKKLSAEEEQLRLMRLQQLEFIRKQKHADLLRRPETAPVQRPQVAQASTATADSVRAEFRPTTDAARRSSATTRSSASNSPSKRDAPSAPTMKQMLASNKIAPMGNSSPLAVAILKNSFKNKEGEKQELYRRLSSSDPESPVKKLAWSSFGKRSSDPGHYDDVCNVTPRQ